MKPKVLYLAFLELAKGDGVSKKIAAQVKAFKKKSECHLCSYINSCNKRSFKVDDHTICEVPNRYSLLYRKHIFNSILRYIELNNINILYIRYTLNADLYYILFLKSVKKIGCKILLEIPTYPYDNEFKKASLKRNILHNIEKLFRKWLRCCCDYIVTTSEEDMIFDTPTIRISNAVDPDDIVLNAPTENKEFYRFVAVGQIAFWHGYDRIILGLKNYYNNNPSVLVYLDIVGDGHSLQDLQTLTKNFNLEKYITFHGRREGAELDLIFKTADMAIGCLGCHRKSLMEVKSLKNVEYAMRGIPFVYSEQNSDFDDKTFVLKCPADESPIVVEELINFVNNNKLSPFAIRESVHTLSWDNQINIILNRLGIADN